MKKLLETSSTKRGLRAGVTAGRGVNVTLAFIFFILVILSLVVIGSLANLHNKLADYPDRSNSSALVCILFSSQASGRFEYGHSHACNAEVYSFAVLAGISVAFLVVSVGRVVVAADIWCTSVLECAVIAVLTVFSFCLGLVITIGLSQTCNTLLDINKEENNCDQNVPDDNKGVKYYDAVDSAQASVWMTFFLLLLLTLVYGIRSFIYVYRLRSKNFSPDNQPILKGDGLEESQTKPI
jgi:hypothetical protein